MLCFGLVAKAGYLGGKIRHAEITIDQLQHPEILWCSK
jgi:hypothetical protein